MSGQPGSRPDRATALRYAAFQLPGFALACTFSLVAVQWFEVPGWAAVLAVALWVTKDALMFPFVWQAYAVREDNGLHDVRGRIGTVEQTLAPRGRVRLGSERWQASVAPEHGAIEAGSAVRVIAVDGLQLCVEPIEGEAGSEAASETGDA